MSPACVCRPVSVEFGVVTGCRWFVCWYGYLDYSLGTFIALRLYLYVHFLPKSDVRDQQILQVEFRYG